MEILKEVGFQEIKIREKENSDDIIKSWNFSFAAEKMVFSGYLTAVKP